MKLSLLTFSMMRDAGEGNLDAEKLCRLAEAKDIHELDMMSFEIGRLYHKEELKAALAAHKMTLGCLIAGVDFILKPDTEDEELQKALDLCNEMGTKNLMIIPGGNNTKEEQDALAAIPRDEMMRRGVLFFTKAVRKARECGIRVGLEDTPQIEKPFVRLEDLSFLLDRVPGLEFIYDVGNILVGDPHADAIAFYKAMKDRIMRVHIKDVVKGHFPGFERCVDNEEIVPVPAGAGITNMRRLLKTMRDDGYDGVLSIEYAKPAGISGEKNADAVAPYADWIRDVWADTDELPPYGRIEGIDIPVSRIFFGTAQMPLFMGTEDDILFDAMYALGINAFDCARGYGLAEKSLGTWVRDRNNRDKVVILTKCGNVNEEGKVHIDRKVMQDELETSLQTLGMDYVDIFLLHRDDPNTPVSEYIDTMNAFVSQGKVRVFGVSNWTRERIEEANAYAASRGLTGFKVSSPNFGLAEQVEDPWGGDCVTISGKENKDVRSWYAQNQMPVLAYSSLARGFFSGRFKSGDYEAAKKILDPAGQRGYLYPVNMDRLNRCEELSKKKGMSVAQIAMSYIFSNDMNLFALVSTSKQKRMKENIYAANHLLSKEEVNFLETGKK